MEATRPNQETSYCCKDLFSSFLALILVNTITEVQDIRTEAWSLTHPKDYKEGAHVSSTRPTQNNPTRAVTPPANTAAPKAESGAFKV